MPTKQTDLVVHLALSPKAARMLTILIEVNSGIDDREAEIETAEALDIFDAIAEDAIVQLERQKPKKRRKK